MKWNHLLLLTTVLIILYLGYDDKLDTKFEDTERLIEQETLKYIHEYFQLPAETIDSLNYDQYKIEQLVKRYYSPGTSDSLKIYLCSGFDSDDVKIQVGEEVPFDKQVTTIPMLGFSESTMIHKPNEGEWAIIEIGSTQIKLSNKAMKKYDQLMVVRKSNRVSLEYRNRIPVFY